MNAQRAALAIILLGTMTHVPSMAQSPISDRHQAAEQLFQEGFTRFQASEFRAALQPLEAALQLYQDLGDRQGEARTLNGLGLVHHQLGDYQQAISLHQKSLDLARTLNNRQGEATALGNLGLSYRNLGQYQQAITLHHQQRDIARAIRNPQGEATALANLGIAYAAQSQYQLAIDVFNQSLTLAKKVGNPRSEAAILNNLGLAHASLGDHKDAIAGYQKALKIQRQIDNRLGESQVLGNLGTAHQVLGNYGQAITFQQQALAIKQQIGDRKGEAQSLGNLGLTYKRLGRYRQAIEFYQQTLGIAQQIGARPTEATTLANLGDTYQALEDYDTAIAFHNRSLKLHQELGNQAGESGALDSLGLAYFSLKKYRKTIKLHRRALTISRRLGDRRGEAISLGNLGNAYFRRGETTKATAHYQQAITLAKALGLREIEGRYLNNLGLLLAKQGQTELAIVFLKQAVNVREQIRKDLQGLSSQEQQSYVNTVADGYRRLADLLLQEDRVLEAQSILDLLKVQELDDLLQDVRGSGEQLEFLQPELELLDQYQTSQQSAIALIQELDQLTQQARSGTLTPQKKQRRQELLQVRQNLQSQFNDFLQQPQVQTLLKQLSNDASREPLDLNKLNSLQDNLTQINGVLLYPLVLEDRLELVLTTPNAPPLRRVVPVSRTQLNRTIAAFRSALDRPTRDAVTPAQQLYDWLIRPLEADLKQANPQTILFAPDGQLRYIPLAALHDGQQWLTQRYQIANITTTSQTDFDTPPTTNPRILAGAFADASITRTVNAGRRSFSFRGLPFAGKEVQNLVAAQPGTTALLDQDLTLPRTIEEIDLHQVMHLATHATFVPSDPNASFIVFGDGKNPTLRDIATWPLSHMDLVVLSACETGVGGKLGSGVEVLGLGYQFQVSGAKAVIASLWQVSDGGTQVLMNAFYDGLQQNLSKAAALQQAQLALINGDYKDAGIERASIRLVGPPKSNLRDLEHPYYWAPFILIGNSL